MAEKTAKTIENTENIEKLSKEQLIELVKEQKVAYDRLLKRRSKLGLSFETPNNRKEMGRDTWDEHIATIIKQNIPYLTKREDKTILQNSGKPTHKLIKGDNFPALMALVPEYKNKVDVIYIDPPYNTGNKDFIYNDRYVDKENGYHHSTWLSFMARRLLLAQELLSNDGVIFVSIDDNEQAHLKILMDEIFGEQNFVSNIIWKSKSGGANNSSLISVDTEYIITFAKSIKNLKFNKIPADTKAYPYTDEFVDKRGKYKTEALDRSSLYHSKGRDYPITTPDNTLIYPGGGSEEDMLNRHKNTKRRPDWVWRWSKKKLEWGLDNGFIEFKKIKGKWKVYTKQYALIDHQGLPIERSSVYRNLIDFANSAGGTMDIKNIFGDRIFPYPKPVKLLNSILSMASKKDSIILDFFAGSGTTGHAVAQLNAEDNGNRHCILITDAGKTGFSENLDTSGNKKVSDEDTVDIAEDITYERMRRVLTGEDWANPTKAVKLDQNLEMFEVNFLPKAEQGTRKTTFELKMDLEGIFVDLGIDENLTEIYAERLYNRWEEFAENDKGDLSRWD